MLYRAGFAYIVFALVVYATFRSTFSSTKLWGERVRSLRKHARRNIERISDGLAPDYEFETIVLQDGAICKERSRFTVDDDIAYKIAGRARDDTIVFEPIADMVTRFHFVAIAKVSRGNLVTVSFVDS